MERRNGLMHCCRAGCPRAGECLRQIAFQQLEESVESVRVLNPRRAQDEDCPYYLKAEKVLYKRGLSRLYDDMTTVVARKVRGDLYGHFGNTQYYRIINGERPVSPAEQKYIASVLRRHGVKSANVYDEEEEMYASGF